MISPYKLSATRGIAIAFHIFVGTIVGDKSAIGNRKIGNQLRSLMVFV